MTEHETMTGSIIGVRDYGTVVLVFLLTDDERTIPVTLEQRAFGWMLEAEDCSPDELVGRRISYDGSHIRFFDKECSR